MERLRYGGYSVREIRDGGLLSRASMWCGQVWGAIKCGLVMVITLRFCFMGIRAMGESF